MDNDAETILGAMSDDLSTWTMEQICESTEMSPARVTYYINKLLDETNYIISGGTEDGGTAYHLTKAGIKYIVENDLD